MNVEERLSIYFFQAKLNFIVKLNYIKRVFDMETWAYNDYLGDCGLSK